MLLIDTDKEYQLMKPFKILGQLRTANTKYLENIRNFDAKNKLKTSIMAFIAT